MLVWGLDIGYPLYDLIDCRFFVSCKHNMNLIEAIFIQIQGIAGYFGS